MFQRIRVPSFLGLCAVLLGASLTAQTTYYVSTSGSNSNNGSQTTPWRTVTHAAATAGTGSTIRIAAGTYGTTGNLEGIEIKGGKQLNIVGAGRGKTIIQANASFFRTIPYKATTLKWWGVFIVHGSGTSVNLSNLTLDANHLETGVSYLGCAVYSDGASGTLDTVELKNAGAATPNGAQGRVGFVGVGKSLSSASSITLKNCYVHGFNKAGIVLAGDGLSGSITGSLVEGAGFLPTGKAAQTGIQLGDGGGPFSVSNNEIRKIWYLPTGWNASGLAVYDTRHGTNTISNNHFVTCKTGYYHYAPTSGSTSFTKNRTSNCRWGANVWSPSSTITDNVFDAEIGVWVRSTVTSMTFNKNSYSDFRTNAGYPTKYFANGNTAIVDLNPDTSCIGLQNPTDVALTNGAGPASIVSADFNGDNKPDFATANSGTNSVTIRFGSGGSDFTTIAGKTVAVAGGPLAVVAGEFSGSAGKDIAVLGADGRVHVLVNNGSGSFTKGTPFDIDGSANDSVPTSLAAGQINGLAQDDLVVGFAGDIISKNGGVRVLHVTAGIITAGATVPGTLRSIRGVALADMNKDGKLDLLATDQSNKLGTSDKLQVFLHSSTSASFLSPAGYAIGTGARGLDVGDLDQDGNPDVAVADFGVNAPYNGFVYVYLGSANGSLSKAKDSPFRVAADAQALRILDLQNDASPGQKPIMDIAVIHAQDSKLTRLRSFSNGGFADYLGCPTRLSPSALTFAKLDNDGTNDLLIASRGGDRVSVYLAKASALAQNYGFGCKGTGNKVPAFVASGTPALPVLGNTSFKLGMINGKGTSIAVLLLGATPANAPACNLQIGALLWLMGTVTNPFGEIQIGLPIPNQPSLAGIDVYYQWGVFDSQGGLGGFLSLSDGMRMRIGY